MPVNVWNGKRTFVKKTSHLLLRYDIIYLVIIIIIIIIYKSFDNLGVYPVLIRLKIPRKILKTYFV